MNVKTMTMWAVGLLVGILMVSGLIIPVTNMFTDEEQTHINKGTTYSLYNPGDTHTIIMDSNGIKTDGGEYQPLPDTSKYGEATLFISTGETDKDGAIVRLSADNTVKLYLYLSGTYVGRDIANLNTRSITVTVDEAGTALFTPSVGIEREIYKLQIYPDANGSYALTYNPLIVSDSPIYGGGNTSLGSVVYGLRFEGTTQALTFAVISPTGGTVTNYNVDLANVATNLYKVNKITATVEGAPEDLTYTYFFAPKEVIYDNPHKVAEQYGAILSILPLFAIISLVLYGAYTIKARRA